MPSFSPILNKHTGEANLQWKSSWNCRTDPSSNFTMTIKGYDLTFSSMLFGNILQFIEAKLLICLALCLKSQRPFSVPSPTTYFLRRSTLNQPKPEITTFCCYHTYANEPDTQQHSIATNFKWIKINDSHLDLSDILIKTTYVDLNILYSK